MSSIENARDVVLETVEESLRYWTRRLGERTSHETQARIQARVHAFSAALRILKTSSWETPAPSDAAIETMREIVSGTWSGDVSALRSYLDTLP